jgi:predicted nucleic acid-binding Zn ribbon protein
MVGSIVASRKVERAGSVLEDLVERLAFRDRLREHEVWTIWDEVVGEILAARSEPIRMEHGKLFVRVAGSAWMQELQFLGDEVRTRLNQKLGAPLVRELFFVLGHGRRPKSKRREITRHPVDEDVIAALVPETGHPEIEAALRRVARARARRLGPDA